MLHTQTVNAELLGVLNALMNNPDFHDYYLVGGTALALQIGHRQSIDIDLFGPKELDEIEILNFLNSIGKVQIIKKSKNILIYNVNGIKVDFVCYKYPWVNPPVSIQNIQMASKADIGAMKLNAITGRGSLKDFIDLYYLFEEFSLKELFNFYNLKYAEGSEFLVLKSLTYFEDAEQDEMPLMTSKLSWEKMKSKIKKEVRNYMKK
jgi:predicted nucleotidyltransferase component of viral defense system